ncbi:hypothetical protein BR93DRAFT_88886 [Coniochaeta sp. PMI_546]|nr:hypothetical protein BR93DRAFT_88886 [Coniochaeta sp. PMI_546]
MMLRNEQRRNATASRQPWGSHSLSFPLTWPTGPSGMDVLDGRMSGSLTTLRICSVYIHRVVAVSSPHLVSLRLSISPHLLQSFYRPSPHNTTTRHTTETRVMATTLRLSYACSSCPSFEAPPPDRSGAVCGVARHEVPSTTDRIANGTSASARPAKDIYLPGLTCSLRWRPQYSRPQLIFPSHAS